MIELIEKEELKTRVKTKKLYYNKTNICDICNVEELNSRCAYKEKDDNNGWTGRWICRKCWYNIYHKKKPDSCNNIRKSLANCRTGNQNPNSDHAKADKSQELACELYGWIDLNKENDNHNSPVDCYDPKTGLYYQVRSVSLFVKDLTYDCWGFANFKKERKKTFKCMICFCKSKDGKTIERIYKFSFDVITNKSGVSIYKSPSRGIQWYEEYRINDEDELKRANKIWKEIIGGS